MVGLLLQKMITLVLLEARPEQDLVAELVSRAEAIIL